MMFWAKNFCSRFFYLYVRFGDMYVYINVLVTEILFMPKGCGYFGCVFVCLLILELCVYYSHVLY